MAHIGLAYIGDSQGSIVVGWLEPSILYARFEQTITGELGARFASRFSSLVGDIHAVRYFADSGELVSYDVIAMAAVFDALLAKRQQFQLITARPWNGALGQRATAFANAFGCVQYVQSAAEFHERMKLATPDGVVELDAFRAALRSGERSVCPPEALETEAAKKDEGSDLTPRSSIVLSHDRRR